MAELFLDSAIRFWVFLPLALITYLFGIIRHYVTILITNEKKPDFQAVIDSHALIRSRLLRENGKYLTKQAFNVRRHFFNDLETGFFKVQKRDSTAKNPMTDPSAMSEMVKGNALNVIPMLVIGTWINSAFTGFLTTKVPFPLTYRFKPMLQKGCESLVSLDASWVSSASWYFLNIFGLRSMYGLVLGQDNSAEQPTMMRDPTSAMAAQAGGQDSQKAFKTEWEALEIVDHTWALKDVANKLVMNGVYSYQNCSHSGSRMITAD